MICKCSFLVAMAAKKKTPATKTSTIKSAEFKRRSEAAKKAAITRKRNAAKKAKTWKKTAKYPTMPNKGTKKKPTAKRSQTGRK